MVRVVCGAFCLGGVSWVRGVLLRFLWSWISAFFLKRFIERSGCVVVSEGFGCVRDSAMVSKGSRLDDADGNPVLLVR